MINLFFTIKNPVSNPRIVKQEINISSSRLSNQLLSLLNNRVIKNDYIFIYDSTNEDLYYGKIKNFLNEVNINPPSDIFKIKTLYSTHYIEFHYFKQIQYSSLKHLYSKNNEKFIGDQNHSLFNMRKKSNVYYAHPIINQSQFKKEVSNNLANEILYEHKIIPRSTEENKTFGRIIEEDEFSYITLTNLKMIRLDLDYINNDLEISKEFYRPYIYEFIVDETQYFKLRDYEQNIYYEVELIDGIPDKSEENLIDGELLFSASPTKNIKAHLKLLTKKISTDTQKDLKKIKEDIHKRITTYKNPKSIANIFNTATKTSNKNSINFSITIYNVGQGNWIRIEIFSDSEKLSEVILDIGKGKSDNPKQTNKISKNAADDISNNHFFVLTHWDLDHIAGITDLDIQQFNKTWFMPMLNQRASESAYRLANFLNRNRNVKDIFIDESLNHTIILDNPHFMLGKGAGNSPGKKITINSKDYSTKYTANNNLGLLLEIKGVKENILLPGDCEYIQMPSDFRKSYSSMVVTHHGASTSLDNNILQNCKRKNGDAIVCVGKDKNYPDNIHKNELLKLGYNVIENRSSKNPINITIT